MNDILRVNNLAKRYPSFSLEGITLEDLVNGNISLPKQDTNDRQP